MESANVLKKKLIELKGLIEPIEREFERKFFEENTRDEQLRVKLKQLMDEHNEIVQQLNTQATMEFLNVIENPEIGTKDSATASEKNKSDVPF